MQKEVTKMRSVGHDISIKDVWVIDGEVKFSKKINVQSLIKHGVIGIGKQYVEKHPHLLKNTSSKTRPCYVSFNDCTVIGSISSGCASGRITGLTALCKETGLGEMMMREGVSTLCITVASGAHHTHTGNYEVIPMIKLDIS